MELRVMAVLLARKTESRASAHSPASSGRACGSTGHRSRSARNNSESGRRR